MKSFDDKFSRHVRDIFDAYEEEYDPAAFERLRAGLEAGTGNKTSMPLMAWIAAASVLIAAGTAWWIASDNPVVSPALTESFTLGRSELDTNPETGFSENNDTALPEALDIPQQENTPSIARISPEYTPDDVISSSVITGISSGNEVIAGVVAAYSSDDNHLTMKSTSHEDHMHLPSQLFESRTIEINRYNTFLEAAPDMDLILSDRMDNNTRTTDKPAASWFEITAGNIMPFTRNESVDGHGFMAGAMHQWRLSKSIRVSTGGLLAYSHFEIDNHSPVRTLRSAIYNQPAVAESQSLNINVDSRQIFDLIALDIPINATWDIRGAGKNQYYLTMGVSSLLFLQQNIREDGVNYSGTVHYDSVGHLFQSNLDSNRYTDNEKAGAFSNFDAARLMNFAIGYKTGYRKNQVSMEFYLKYPLAASTVRDISMGMGGISLKYSLRK